MTAPNPDYERAAIAAYDYAESTIGVMPRPWAIASERMRDYYRELVRVAIAAHLDDGSGAGS